MLEVLSRMNYRIVRTGGQKSSCISTTIRAGTKGESPSTSVLVDEVILVGEDCRGKFWRAIEISLCYRNQIEFDQLLLS